MLDFCFADKTAQSVSEVWEEAVCEFGSKTPECADEQDVCVLLATAAQSSAGQERWVGLSALNCLADASDAVFKEHLLKGAKPIRVITESSWPLIELVRGLEKSHCCSSPAPKLAGKGKWGMRRKSGVLRPQLGGRAGSRVRKCFSLAG